MHSMGCSPRTPCWRRPKALHCRLLGIAFAGKVRSGRCWLQLRPRWLCSKPMFSKLKNSIRQRVTRHYGVPETPLALERLRSMNFAPTHIFDVGAHAGEFARLCRRIWPRAKLTCFEVLPHRVAELQAWSASDGNVDVIPCLLGAETRNTVPFHEMETASSVLEEHLPPRVPVRSYPMTTIDEVIGKSELQPPAPLKLDLQGFEVAVLNGA